MNRLFSIMAGLALFSYVCLNFRRAVKKQREENLKEDLAPQEQKKKSNLAQESRDKLFLYFAIAGGCSAMFLKNTMVGYFVVFGSIVLSCIVLFNSLLKWRKKKAILSLLLMIILITLLASLFWPQIIYLYSDRIK